MRKHNPKDRECKKTLTHCLRKPRSAWCSTNSRQHLVESPLYIPVPVLKNWHISCSSLLRHRMELFSLFQWRIWPRAVTQTPGPVVRPILLASCACLAVVSQIRLKLSKDYKFCEWINLQSDILGNTWVWASASGLILTSPFTWFLGVSGFLLDTFYKFVRDLL